jgi:Leucine-rich repeat (LRR) protein
MPSGSPANSTAQIGAICRGDHQQVELIVLPSNNLVGSLPPELGLLTSLKHFSVFQNSLTGSLPSSLKAWSNLEYLNLESNHLTGSLNSSWFQFPQLQYLALGNNQLTGSLPSSIRNMPRLHEVALDHNLFAGGVDVFQNCTNLKILYLQSNKLNGSLSNATFEKLTALQEVDLSDNQFKGSFPEALYGVSQVDVHLNQLTGSLPDVQYAANRRPITFLSLYQNKMTGSIPATLALLTGLVHLDLSKNKLTGSIPDDLQQLTNLEYLFLHKNPFAAGRIPYMFGMSKLKELSLQETNRNSSLPSWIGTKLPNLELLDLHENSLTGSIPSDFGNLSSMRYLFLNKNQLGGSLPWQLMYLQQMAVFMIDQNALVGTDAAVCGINQAPTLVEMVGDCDELKCDCCTKCCANNDPSCNTLEPQVNNDNSFARDHTLFAENLTFK